MIQALMTIDCLRRIIACHEKRNAPHLAPGQNHDSTASHSDGMREYVTRLFVHLTPKGCFDRFARLHRATDGGPVIGIRAAPGPELQQDPSSIIDEKQANGGISHAISRSARTLRTTG